VGGSRIKDWTEIELDLVYASSFLLCMKCSSYPRGEGVRALIVFLLLFPRYPHAIDATVFVAFVALLSASLLWDDISI
jgi:hypothetical protein